MMKVRQPWRGKMIIKRMLIRVGSNTMKMFEKPPHLFAIHCIILIFTVTHEWGNYKYG